MERNDQNLTSVEELQKKITKYQLENYNLQKEVDSLKHTIELMPNILNLMKFNLNDMVVNKLTGKLATVVGRKIITEDNNKNLTIYKSYTLLNTDSNGYTYQCFEDNLEKYINQNKIEAEKLMHNTTVNYYLDNDKLDELKRYIDEKDGEGK